MPVDSRDKAKNVKLGDLISVVMDAVVDTTGDEKMASVIASRVLTEILTRISPEMGRELLAVFAKREINA
jgi:hypothetical protein